MFGLVCAVGGVVAGRRVACRCLRRVGGVRVDADAGYALASGCGVPGFCWDFKN